LFFWIVNDYSKLEIGLLLLIIVSLTAM